MVPAACPGVGVVSGFGQALLPHAPGHPTRLVSARRDWGKAVGAPRRFYYMWNRCVLQAFVGLLCWGPRAGLRTECLRSKLS